MADLVDETKELDVLVVAYGDSEPLARCLDALGGAYPVTIVDNSSSETTRQLAHLRGATYLDSGSNLGFGAALNKGLGRFDLSKTDVLLLNPDASIEPAAVEALRRNLHSEGRVACVAPAQHRPGSNKPSPVAWPFPSPSVAWGEAAGLGRMRTQWGYVIASVLLVNGEALLEVGGFDEGFFLYAEEADWERRASALGWKISYSPDVQAVHVGAATDSEPARRELRFHAGMERYVRKWHGPLGWRSYQVGTVLTALRRTVLLTGHRGDSLRLARIYAAGPHRLARRRADVPQRRHHVPTFCTADGRRAVAPSRVLLLDSSGYEDLGGASTVLDELIDRVDRGRFVPVLACLSPGRWPEEVRSKGTEAYSFPRTRLRSAKNLSEIVLGLRTLVRRHSIDLIHASENSAFLYAAIVGRITRIPVIWHVHSPLTPRSREERVTSTVLKRMPPAHVVYTSPGAREKTSVFSGFDSSVVLPGLDLERCASGRAERARRSLDIPDDVQVVSMFGRVFPMKGQKDFVECVARLNAQGRKLFAVMCGGGDREDPYWRHLDELKERHGLSERLLMPGYVSPPLKDDIVAASDVVIHPSHAESFGLAIAEAMAASRPVVAADADGPRMLIEDGVSGLIVPPGDPDALAEAVGRLLDDEELRVRLGEQARLAVQRYGVEQMVEQFEELWDRVLADSGGTLRRRVRPPERGASHARPG
jgi:glycosyltransferase involved in cell wall biosynthesis/GT2 family glycosyltransferase